jgi:SAM-dependent methyltransferase
VLDLGCGLGKWLKAFHETGGISDLTGVDGDWVDFSRFACPAARFVAHDLNRPIDLHRQFDLVVSVEVAEHLRPESADVIVDSIARHGKVVAFSAAIPRQGGQNHLNEQWPGFWVERFRRRDFVPVDCFRRTIWDDDHVLWWYAQNLLLFVHGAAAHAFREIRGYNEAPALVHPKLYNTMVARSDLRTRSGREMVSVILRRYIPGKR